MKGEIEAGCDWAIWTPHSAGEKHEHEYYPKNYTKYVGSEERAPGIKLNCDIGKSVNSAARKVFVTFKTGQEYV